MAALLFFAFTSHSQIENEIEQCKRNLRGLSDAIMNFRRDHQRLPDGFADLAPKYIGDSSVLVCPTARRTGRSIPFGVEDSTARKLSTYTYEFSPRPRASAYLGIPPVTDREFKRRQMGLIGSKTPIVRCLAHGEKQVLNLPFEGPIYTSGVYWEHNFTNLVNASELMTARGVVVPRAFPVPARATDTPAQLLNLSPFYNAPILEPWLFRDAPLSLTALPPGVQTLGGTPFDLRGLIQLGSKLVDAIYPEQIVGIPVNAPARGLHFLHGATHSTSNGVLLAVYKINFANQTSAEIPIHFGAQLGEAPADPPPHLAENSALAWTEPANADPARKTHRLYKTNWRNPDPKNLVTSIDLISKWAEPAVFVVAISLDP